MCRFVAYIGSPILLDEVLFKPKNSLIKQSTRAKESEVVLNGDGFGIGWYNHEIDPEPGLFTSIQPAWNDRNLAYISPKIRSGCFFTHVRAATGTSVSYFNCHPFHYKRFLFMHNGAIGHFKAIKRQIRRKLSDEAYESIKGQTDSEHFFALFLDYFIKKGSHHSVADIVKILKLTLNDILKMQQKFGDSELTRLNVVITDGYHMIAMRYASDIKRIHSLHYSFGSRYQYRQGLCHMDPATERSNGAVIIASEKLDNHRADWNTVPPNHILTIDDDLSIGIDEL